VTERVTSTDKDEQVPAFFSRDIVLFPGMQISMTLGEEKGKDAVSHALQENRLVAFIPTDFERERQGIGVLTLVAGTERMTNAVRVELKGLWRVKVSSPTGLGSGPLVKVEKLEETEGSRRDGESTIRRVHAQLDEFRELIPDIPAEVTTMLSEAKTASELSDLCAMSPTLTHEERLELLSTLDPDERLGMLSRHFDRELEVLRNMVEAKPIPECEICADLADSAFDAEQGARAEAIVELLNHMVGNHTTELLNVLAEKYGPSFMKRRSLR
jgi:ATP-dependent Lon protease